MKKYTDEWLMARVKSGELINAGLLFERYQKKIYGFFIHSLANKDDALDATQETFSRMLKYRKSYDENKRFSAWLFSIAINQRNLSLNARKITGLQDELATDIEDTSSQPPNPLYSHQFQNQIETCLVGLPSDANVLLNLYLRQERDYQQLADIFDSKVATIRVKVHRALKLLRACVSKAMGDES